jgi:hypothetical protein
MMSSVIDLASRRRAPAEPALFPHPSGVRLPLGDQSGGALIAPELRADIGAGTYGAAMIARLPDALRAGDRVLVIGGGLGVLSTLVANSGLVERVLVIEADLRFAPYLDQVHTLNGVPWVETLNAVPANGQCGRVPFFARADPRKSSFTPDEGDWVRAMMVPFVDFGLILADERISLIVWDAPTYHVQTLTEVELGPVERALINCDDYSPDVFPAPQTKVVLGGESFSAEDCAGSILLRRQRSGAKCDVSAPKWRVDSCG